MTESYADQQYWDASYTGLQLSRTPDHDPVRQWIQRYAKAGKGDCIEIGAFPGRYLSVFGELGYTVHGVDLTPRIEKDLPDYFKSCGFRVGEFYKQDFMTFDPHQRYDIVSSFGFIEHFENWKSVLDRHIQLVKDDGWLIVEAPNMEGPLQKLLHSELDEINLSRHNLDSMKPDIWAQIAVDAGFEVVFSGYFGGFDFWVDQQQRTNPQLQMLNHLSGLMPLLRTIKEDNRAYSPYCGLIARRDSR